MQNHIRSGKIIFVLGAIFLSFNAQAFEYNSVSDCRKAFLAAHPNDYTIPGADAFCKPKMDPIVFCQDSELLKNLTPPEGDALTTEKTRLHNACVASNGAPLATTTASANSLFPANTYGVPQPTLDYSSCGVNPTETCKMVVQSNAGQKYQADVLSAQQKAATASQQAAAAAAAQQAQQNQNNAAMAPALLNTAGSLVSAAQPAGSNAAQGAASAVTYSPGVIGAQPPASTPFGGNVTEAVNKALADAGIKTTPIAPTQTVLTADQQAAIQKNAAEVTNTAATKAAEELKGSGLEKPAADAAGSVGADPGVAPKSPITEASESASTAFKSEIDGFVTSAAAAFSATPFFAKTVAGIKGLQPALTDPYIKSKPTCADGSEMAQKLCVEGTSPGAKIARALMDASGPVLMAMNSAQKACSTTSKVSKLAGMGMIAANGVCIAYKMKCETACEASNKNLIGVEATLKTAVDANYSLDLTACSSNQACQKFFTENQKQIEAAKNDFKNAVIKSFKNQQQVATGTANGLKAICQSQARNIMGMLANIGALAMAKKGGDECEKKLSTTGAAGNALTAQQYCETPANTSSQFCKCQGNQTAQGCPGYKAAGSADVNSASDPAGTNLKPNSGLSNFAGGGAAGTNGSDYSLGSGKDGGDGSDFKPFEAGPGGAANGGPSGAGVGSSGGGSGPGSEAAAVGDKKDKDDKKWGFGAFGGGGGMFGGGNKGGKDGNGDLKDQQAAAIERKLASDKYSAEVTSASGTSNWEKVHRTAVRVESSLMGGR